MAVGILKRKVLRKIYCPIRVGDDFRIRTNRVLYNLLNELDVVKRINIQRMRWLRHYVRKEEDVSARRLFDEGISERRTTKKLFHCSVFPIGEDLLTAEASKRNYCGCPKSDTTVFRKI